MGILVPFLGMSSNPAGLTCRPRVLDIALGNEGAPITVAAMAFGYEDIAKMSVVGLIGWLGGNHNGAKAP